MGKGYLDTPGIHDDSHVDAWRKITDAVHANGGRIFLQLWHVGRISHLSLLPEGRQPLAPSAIRADQQTFTANGFEDCSEPVAMTQEQIDATVAEFREGAERAMEAGFDGVEVHAANGYLLDQFIQDRANKRDDAYGGSIENRMRFVSDVIDAVSEVWPKDRIGVRVSPLGHANDIGDSDTEGTFTAVYKMLDEKNLAYLHVMEQFPGTQNDTDATALIKRLRDHYGGFVISNGGLRSVSGGQGDCVGSCACRDVWT